MIFLCSVERGIETEPNRKTEKNKMSKINLGDRVKDKVSGFTGIVIAESKYLTGCKRFGVRSEKLKDGQITEPQWFDEIELDAVKAGVVKIGNVAGPTAGHGGPQPTPKRQPKPERY
jgi:hypothetical protein